MKYLRPVQYALWGLALVITSLAAFTTGWWQNTNPNEASVMSEGALPVPGIGGPFTMTDHRGRPFTEHDLQGPSSLMFFGFTSCPDVCPTTLANISRYLRDLGKDAKHLNAVFVSVDPERDTSQRLSQYLTAFDTRIVGLTGSQHQLLSMAQAYRFYFKKVELAGGDYTIDHTALVYILDAEGKFAGTIDFHEDPQTAVAKIRLALAHQASLESR